MSVINKMLQELDRRNATAGSEAEQPPQQVKAVAAANAGREWFWRIVAILMLCAVAWVGWVAFQLQPRPSVATELAFKAAEQARLAAPVSGPISALPPTTQAPAPAAQPAAPAPQAVPPAAVPQPASPPPAAQPAPAPAAPVASVQKPAAREPAETLKLAHAIQTPITERPAQEPAKPEPVKPEAAKPEPAKPAAKKAEPKRAASPKAPATASPAPGKSTVDKRDRSKTTSETAEAHFRRAAVLLNQGRVSEAEDHLVGALQADASHAAARQAYVALLLEQQRADAAKRILKETLAANPEQPTFALALARILAEQRDYPGALEVMDRAGSVSQNADFQALRGTVLQRMGRHQEAVDAYQTAVQGAAQPGTTWVGMAISLEAVGRKADAAQAYRRSLGSGLSREVREYAESRVRALE